jgi:hypothetical protein
VIVCGTYSANGMPLARTRKPATGTMDPAPKLNQPGPISMPWPATYRIAARDDL